MKTSISIVPTDQANADKFALRWYWVPGLIAGILSLLWLFTTKLNVIPITGPSSIGRLAIILSCLTGIISFATTYYAQQQASRKKRPLIFWRDLITLTFAHGVVLFGVLAILTFLMNASFTGLQLDIYTSSALVGAVAAVSNYLMIFLALTVGAPSLIAVLSIILIGGVLVATTTNNQPDWWQVHFSYLGMASSSNALAFNLTLITSSLVMLALTEYIFGKLQASQKDTPGLWYLKWLFVGSALGLGGVGLFPYTADSILALLHNGSAFSMVVFIIAMIVGLRWFVPTIQSEFLRTSYTLGGLLLLSLVAFYFTGYMTLTAFELLAFAISFVWLILLLRNLQFWSASRSGNKKTVK